MSFEVLPYKNKRTIIDYLVDDKVKFIKDLPTSENKHFAYIENYFDYLGVKTLVFEFDYIDKDYLEDFSSYYSRCFKDYQKKCIRVHAFSTSFGRKLFENIITRKAAKKHFVELAANYIGFIVLKPIPLTLFGRTCLKVYPRKSEPNNNETRFYPIVRDYKINLFGLNLTVKSLAFQEQDKAVSACATSALWSSFQGTGCLFHHHYPSPYEITLSATKIIAFSDRSFPNKGLVIQQMAHAIREVNLEPILIDSLNTSYFKAYINAFLKGSIPLIIGFELYDKRGDLEKDVRIGFHAVTATGFCIDSSHLDSFELITNTKTEKESEFFMQSSRISKVYVHDDQLGPFARMKFDANLAGSLPNSLSTTWSELDNLQFKNVRAIPKVLLIPVYNKIRIPFDKIREIIYDFNTQVLIVDAETNYVWDIYITTVVKYKSIISNAKNLSKQIKLNILTKSFPKYIWVVDAYIQDEIALTFVFDATDIENGQLLLCSIHYNHNTFELIREIANDENGYNIQKNHIKNILNHYKDTTANTVFI